MADRRVHRTRRRLNKALLELMQEKGYGRITVQELTERADVARSTFYAHFDSKDDLLFAGFDRWLLDLARVRGVDAPREEGFRFSLPLLRHARGHRRVFRGIFGRAGSPRAARRFQDLLVQVVLQELPGDPGEERLREARAHTVAGAFMALVAWWFESGAGVPPEEVDRAFRDAVAPPSRLPSPATG